MVNSIVLKPQVTVNGRVWNLYSFDFQTADGLFSSYLYAISFEHAAAILEELKETAKLSGQIIHAVSNER
jgi:hypothetical protein